MRPDELEPLSPAMKSLLDAERPLDTVPAATRAKLFTKVSASVAGMAAAGGAIGSAALGGGKAVGATAAASTAATATAVTGTAAVTTKVLIAAAVAFTVGSGVGATVHAVVAPPKQVVQPAPIVIRIEPPAPLPVPEPEPVVEEPKAPAPPKPAPAPKRSDKDNLGAERSLIEQARAALSRHEVRAALGALQQHEREFPAGQLTEERLALEVIALAEVGDAARARDVATKFRSRYPASLLMPAVDNASPP